MGAWTCRSCNGCQYPHMSTDTAARREGRAIVGTRGLSTPTLLTVSMARHLGIFTLLHGMEMVGYLPLNM